MTVQYPLALYLNGWNDLDAFKIAADEGQEKELRAQGYKRLNEPGCTIADIGKPAAVAEVMQPVYEPVMDASFTEPPPSTDKNEVFEPSKPRRGRPARK